MTDGARRPGSADPRRYPAGDPRYGPDDASGGYGTAQPGYVPDYATGGGYDSPNGYGPSGYPPSNGYQDPAPGSYPSDGYPSDGYPTGGYAPNGYGPPAGPNTGGDFGGADTGSFQPTGGYGDTGPYGTPAPAPAPVAGAPRGYDQAGGPPGRGYGPSDATGPNPTGRSPTGPRRAAAAAGGVAGATTTGPRRPGAAAPGGGRPGTVPPGARRARPRPGQLDPGRPGAARGGEARRPGWDEDSDPGPAQRPGAGPGARRRPPTDPGARRRPRPTDDGPASGPGRARRRPPPPPPVDDVDDDLDDGEVSLVRRFVTAALVLAAAFSVGIALAVVWQQVGGSDDSSAAGQSPNAGSAGATTPATAPTASATGPAAVAVPVPPDWVAYTDATQQATFSHPPNWEQRNDGTGVFFSETADTASGLGAQMIGVARTTDPSQQQAVTNVQQSEFGTAGLTNYTPGTPTEADDGSGAWGVSGSYDREGERVAYVMRSVQTPNAVYVMIARGPADQQQQTLTLLGALQSSFSPS